MRGGGNRGSKRYSNRGSNRGNNRGIRQKRKAAARTGISGSGDQYPHEASASEAAPLTTR